MLTDAETKILLMSCLSCAIRNCGDNAHIADRLASCSLVRFTDLEICPEQVDRVMRTLTWSELRAPVQTLSPNPVLRKHT